MENAILYEHPLHETVRVCLRLECLFAQVDNRQSFDGYWNNRATVASIVDIVNVLDRPDFKSKLCQRLINCKENLNQHLNEDQVDQDKLHQILDQLASAIEFLNSTTTKLNQSLIDNEFLNGVRLRLSKTGGARNFDFPMYHYWLHLPETKRKADIEHWISLLADVQKSVALFLMLTRQSAQFFPVLAENGYYENNLDTSTDFQLLRFYIDKQTAAFPDISVGRHRMSLHFYTLNNCDERPVQFKEDVNFRLALCV